MSTFGDIGRLWQEKYKTHFNFRKVLSDLPKTCRSTMITRTVSRKSTRTVMGASELLLGLVRLG